MILQVKCEINRKILIWAAAYLLEHRSHGYLMKREVLEFLRNQLSQFGTECLTGENWDTDFWATIPEATKWVEKRFPNLK